MAALVETKGKVKQLCQPVPNDNLVAKVLNEYWSVVASKIKRLESYDDANYYIEDKTNDKEYLLKFHNAVESENKSLLDGYSSLLNHLSYYCSNIQFPVPISIKDDNKQDIIFINDCPVVGNTHELIGVRLYKWVSGITLNSYTQSIINTINEYELNIELYSQLSIVIANMRYAIDTHYYPMQQPPTHVSFMNRQFLWDIRQFELVQPYFHYFQPTNGNTINEENDILNIITDIYTHYKHDIVPNDSLFRFSTIMGDCNDANIIVQKKNMMKDSTISTQADNVIHMHMEDKDTDKSCDNKASVASVASVVGIIDFGDTIYTYSINEIAIAIAYALLTPIGIQYPLEIMKEMLITYCKTLHQLELIAFTDLEIRQFRLLIAIRLATSVTIGHYSIIMNPQNEEYLKLHAIPARKALFYIWNQLHNKDIVELIQSVMKSL